MCHDNGSGTWRFSAVCMEVGVHHKVGGRRTERRRGMLDANERYDWDRHSPRFSTFRSIPSACTRVVMSIRVWYRWDGSGSSAVTMVDLTAISLFTVGLTPYL